MDATIEQAHQDLGFHGGHIALVAFVAVALVGLTYMKNPDLFHLHSRGAQAAAQNSAAPKYYAYVDPPQPTVLGDTTQPAGPSVINEDGTITPMADGQVLGVSTEDVQSKIDSIHITTVPTTAAAVDAYYHYVVQLEGQYVGIMNIEGALSTTASSSVDHAQLQKSTAQIDQLLGKLGRMYVPEDAATFHKLKIARYYAARQLLAQYDQLDQNPEAALQQLGIFLKAQQQEDQELTRLSGTYHLNVNATN